MKKRILSLIIAILLLLPCFATGVSAAKPPSDGHIAPDEFKTILVSTDYKTLTYNNTSYVRFDTSIVGWDYYNSFTDTNSNLEEVKRVDYEFNQGETIIVAYIHFKDGSSFNSSYINENYYNEYLELIYSAERYTVEFFYPQNNSVSATSKQILGKKTTLALSKLWVTDFFNVHANSHDDSFYIKKGSLILIDEQYYYVDFTENNIADVDAFYPDDYDSLTAYEIIDDKLLEELAEAYSEFNSDAIGFLTSDFSEKISIVLLCLVFVLVPFAALILFLILSLRAKNTVYKKLFRTIYIISAVELIIFAVIVSLFLIF